MVSQKVLDALKATQKPLEEVQPTFKGLLYGGIGAGKTYTTMIIAHKITPLGKRILYVDYAEGWTAIKDVDQIVARSTRYQFDSLSQLEYLAEAIADRAPGFDDVGTVVLDEYSSMVDNNLEKIVNELHKEDPGKHDKYMPEWPHFNRNKIQASRVHRRFSRIPGVNVLYIAHVKERVEQASGLAYVEPNFNPSYGKDFLQDLQLVGLMTAKVQSDKYTRKIQVQPEKRVAAKNRLGFDKTQVSPSELISAITNFIDPKPKEDTKPKAATPIEVP